MQNNFEGGNEHPTQGSILPRCSIGHKITGAILTQLRSNCEPRAESVLKESQVKRRKHSAVTDHMNLSDLFIGKGRKYDLQMKRSELENLGQYDCVLIVTDHSDYDYRSIVQESALVVDTRNATRGIDSSKIVHC